MHGDTINIFRVHVVLYGHIAVPTFLALYCTTAERVAFLQFRSSIVYSTLCSKGLCRKFVM